MRKDMADVLCDEPRRGMRTKDRKGRKRNENRIPLDEQPKKEKGSLRRRWKTNWYDHKEFGDHVQPLRRYILSCVGRKWDDVYSEIRQTIPKGSVVNNHLYTHLFQYIATNVYLIKDIPYDGDYSTYHGRNHMQIYQETYVHPDTGIICCTPEARRRRKKVIQKKYISKNDTSVYCKDKNGIWWECLLTEVPAPYQIEIPFIHGSGFFYSTHYPSVHDSFLKTKVNEGHELLVQYGNSKQYCFKKRQLNKDEIRKCKLNKTSSGDNQ